MDFNFVYSSGGGAGDWNGVNRVWKSSMPDYFKNNLLIKFGDIFFNHKGINSLLKPKNWKNVDNGRDWLFERINDDEIYSSNNLILDVGTTKIVNYISFKKPSLGPIDVISQFDKIIENDNILEKYCNFIMDSNIKNAVTFDIPNPFKVRNQDGHSRRLIFNDKECKKLLVEKCVKYANFTFKNGVPEDRLLTILPGFLNDIEIKNYFSKLDYVPKKLAIGALIDMNDKDFIMSLKNINRVLYLKNYEKVHFLGCGGFKKAQLIKSSIGNYSNFSVDNTTAFNRAIDGNKKNTAWSGYYDYGSKKLIRIKDEYKHSILSSHERVPKTIRHFDTEEIKEILKMILQHQNGHSSIDTYNNRAKLIIHNFDVYRYHAE